MSLVGVGDMLMRDVLRFILYFIGLCICDWIAWKLWGWPINKDQSNLVLASAFTILGAVREKIV